MTDLANAERHCTRCNVDISQQHYHAVSCLSCAAKWGSLTGARKAYAAVFVAVKKGLLIHPTLCVCVDCGKTASDYDHRDYNQPLNVVPVCRSCNKRRGPAIKLREQASSLDLFDVKKTKPQIVRVNP